MEAVNISPDSVNLLITACSITLLLLSLITLNMLEITYQVSKKKKKKEIFRYELGKRNRDVGQRAS